MIQSEFLYAIYDKFTRLFISIELLVKFLSQTHWKKTKNIRDFFKKKLYLQLYHSWKREANEKHEWSHQNNTFSKVRTSVE